MHLLQKNCVKTVSSMKNRPFHRMFYFTFNQVVPRSSRGRVTKYCSIRTNYNMFKILFWHKKGKPW